MRGTVICGVTGVDEGRDALELAAELSDRLGLRLVLAYVVDGIGTIENGDGGESVSMKADREGAARTVARLAAEHGVADRAEQRSAVGDPAALFGRIAAEEAADMIVVGARPRGRLRRGLVDGRLAQDLETETRVPVLIVPPRTRRRESTATNGGRR